MSKKDGSPSHQPSGSGQANRSSRSPEKRSVDEDTAGERKARSSSEQRRSLSISPGGRFKKKHSNLLGDLRQYLFVLNCSLSYITVGCSISWSAPLIYKAEKFGLEGEEFSVIEGVVIGSLIFLGMLVTPIPVGILCDCIGRKWALIIAGGVACCSWLLVMFANGLAMVYGSRLLAGFSAGSVMTVAPIYISEVARPSIRGSLHAITLIMLLLGAEVTFILGPNVEFREMAVTCGIVPHVSLVLMLFFPESPYWLINKKKYQEARKNFEWLRGSKLANNRELRMEFQQIVALVDREFPKQGHFKRLYSTKANKNALIIVESLHALQRLTGISSITAYSAVTIPDRYIGRLHPASVITVLGFVWVASTAFAFFLIDRLGRVPLLIISCIGCFIATASCAAWYYANRTSLDTPSRLPAHWFPFAGFTLYGVFYICGLGTVPGVLHGEMFSPDNRAFASAITVMVTAGCSLIVNALYSPVGHKYGFHVNFAFYSIMSLLSLLFTLSAVPETKGKPLYVIQELLAEQF